MASGAVVLHDQHGELTAFALLERGELGLEARDVPPAPAYAVVSTTRSVSGGTGGCAARNELGRRRARRRRPALATREPHGGCSSALCYGSNCTAGGREISASFSTVKVGLTS